MLKLDFERAVLQRIPKIAANSQRPWRDILFVADEYRAFATVGEPDSTGDERAFALSRQARLQCCYLNPHYLDVQTSYFEHVARDDL